MQERHQNPGRLTIFVSVALGAPSPDPEEAAVLP